MRFHLSTSLPIVSDTLAFSRVLHIHFAFMPGDEAGDAAMSGPKSYIDASFIVAVSVC